MSCLRNGCFLLLLSLAPGCASFRHPDDPWWGPDKAKHFTASFALAAGGTMALTPSAGENEAAAMGFSAALAAGAGKEIHDRNIKRTYFSGKDLAWDLIGSLLGSFAGLALTDE